VVPLKKAGREHKACCPFHNEKTPSFTVVDDKGFYHCFGCGVHGSIFDFVMEYENCTFPEAVERLASQAGIPVPQPTPEEAARYQKQLDIYETLEQASDFFYGNLTRPEGKKAVAYLKSRGLTGKTAKEFQLGYAPDKSKATKTHLMSAGAQEEDLIAAGLCGVPGDGGASYDRFRGRLMFPIQSLNGKVIGFGGRILDKDSKGAKYLNSPETEVFHKGQILYNLRQARRHCEAQALVVVEGYMDVIGLHQAGIQNAVAPLGTALTPEQIKLMWQYVDTIFVCFDGDAAGHRAAERTIERVLPLIEPGKEIRFVHLPEGMDPDDVVRTRGAAAFRSLMGAAKPLADAIFAHERSVKPLKTPEAKSDLYRRLDKRADAITDWGLKKSYQQHFRKLAGGLFASGKAPSKFEGQGIRTRLSDLERNCEALCLALVNHPALMDEVGEELGALPMPSPALEGLKLQILNSYMSGEEKMRVNHRFSPRLGEMFRLTSAEAPVHEVQQWWQETYHEVAAKLNPKLVAKKVEIV